MMSIIYCEQNVMEIHAQFRYWIQNSDQKITNIFYKNPTLNNKRNILCKKRIDPQTWHRLGADAFNEIVKLLQEKYKLNHTKLVFGSKASSMRTLYLSLQNFYDTSDLSYTGLTGTYRTFGKKIGTNSFISGYLIISNENAYLSTTHISYFNSDKHGFQKLTYDGIINFYKESQELLIMNDKGKCVNERNNIRHTRFKIRKKDNNEVLAMDGVMFLNIGEKICATDVVIEKDNRTNVNTELPPPLPNDIKTRLSKSVHTEFDFLRNE